MEKYSCKSKRTIFTPMGQDAEGGLFGHFCILEMFLLLCEFRHEYEVGLYFTSSINHSAAMPGVDAHVHRRAPRSARPAPSNAAAT